ncbi:glycoside hydrolase family 130 protein [Poriferisphaera sp. WC338]|uniref:glycoside hydrolase family 130 protein n=1 Tax=Poriferisphaera sp. WC338 TaxID=3425129 RepID=UPI003D814566
MTTTITSNTLRQKKYITHRHPNNPILTAADFPNDIVTAFNAGVIKHNDQYFMVCRTEDSALGRYMWVCDSTDGINFTPRPEPLRMPTHDPVFMKYVHPTKSYWDPRIVRLDNTFYITHAADVTNGQTCQLGLFKIDDDFNQLDWLGLISLPDNRNAVLFPDKIGGAYYRLDRPNDNSFDIWLSSSPDLIHWGNHRRVIAKKDVFWSDQKIGPGSVPIKTPHGWLCIIHGVRRQCTDQVYSLGAMLLDLDDPSKVLGISQRAILAPETTYELIGQSPSVVFTNGSILEPDGTVRIYYGAADTVLGLATASLDDLIHACLYE